MADAFEVLTIGTGDPAPTDPAVLTPEQVADMLQTVAAADVDVAVQQLDQLLARLRPATGVRRTLARVPASTLWAAVALLASRQERR
jgi:hypothetical protein